MIGVINKDDFKTVRSFTRFLKMGVLASTERAAAVLDVAKAVDPQRLALGEVVVMAEAVRRGTMPSEEICAKAETALDNFYLAQQHNMQSAADRQAAQEFKDSHHG